MRTKQGLLLLVILMVSFSCKTKQKVSQAQSAQKHTVEALVDDIKQAQPKFSTANVSKMNVNLDLNGRSMSVAATCKLIANQEMHISIMPAFGIELFKVEINRDSIYVLDKFNRKNYATDYATISKKAGFALNYSSIEALIVNKFYIVGQDNPNPDFMTTAIDGQGNRLVYSDDKFQQNISVNDKKRIVKQNIVSKKDNYIMNAAYSDFETQNNIAFPRKININFVGGRQIFNFEFSISRFSFNDKLSLEPADKSRYTKANIDQLLIK